VRQAERIAVVLGAADGLTLALSEILGLRAHQPAIFPAGLSAGLGELVGMGAALWLSSEGESSFLAAAGCGIATMIACVLPCIPFALVTGWLGLVLAMATTAVLGAVVCWLRPEHGWKAIGETYGVLLAAGALCYLASLVR
jgi:VIT1/CCC1 family predicted Fe2+/Mn2+ transporter